MNEEEKKVINIFIEKCYKYDESVEIKGISVGEESRMLDTVCKALNLIEKLQKENEELHKEIDRMKSLDIYKLVEDWETGQLISIQKVKDKIEELNRKIDKSIDNSKGGLDEEFIENAAELLIQKRILQELLEK